MEKSNFPSPFVSVDKNIHLKDSSWSFATKGLSHSFATHIEKSIPSYQEGHKLIIELSDYFIPSDESITIYDLGCSVGDLTKKLAQKHKHKKAIFVGIDKEEQMIKKAQETNSHLDKIFYTCCDFLSFPFEQSSLFISYYSLQFLSFSSRTRLLEKIYHKLEVGGAFIVFEKVLEQDSYDQDIFSTLYRHFKSENNFLASEIIGKEQSLKGILKPFTRDENFTLFKKIGFKKITLLMKNLHFEGYLLRK